MVRIAALVAAVPVACVGAGVGIGLVVSRVSVAWWRRREALLLPDGWELVHGGE